MDAATRLLYGPETPSRNPGRPIELPNRALGGDVERRTFIGSHEPRLGGRSKIVRWEEGLACTVSRGAWQLL